MPVPLIRFHDINLFVCMYVCMEAAAQVEVEDKVYNDELDEMSKLTTNIEDRRLLLEEKRLQLEERKWMAEIEIRQCEMETQTKRERKNEDGIERERDGETRTKEKMEMELKAHELDLKRITVVRGSEL